MRLTLKVLNICETTRNYCILAINMRIIIMFFASECCANIIKTQQRINKIEEETGQVSDGRTTKVRDI